MTDRRRRTIWHILRKVRTCTATLLIAISLGGCAMFDTERYWESADGDGFLLSYELNLPAKQIVFTEKFFPGDRPDAERDMPRSRAPKSKLIQHIDDCQFVDALNWNCEDRGLGDESIYMIKGELYYNFFTEGRRYRARNVLGARLAPCATTEFAKCRSALAQVLFGAGV